MGSFLTNMVAENLPLALCELVIERSPKAPNEWVDSGCPLLILKLEERGKLFDEPDFTSFRVYDPGRQEQGLREIFKGPGNEQSLQLDSPLYMGWGLSVVELDQKKEPEEVDHWSWYHFPTGKIGPYAGKAFWVREEFQGWLMGEIERSGKGTALVRYHPKKGIRQETDLVFGQMEWSENGRVLGVATIEGENRLLDLNIREFTYRDVGIDPKALVDPDGARNSSLRIRRAADDGFFASTQGFDDFELWYLPGGGIWTRVISKVKIVKTFGGVAPSLPVAYLGGGRFAVSRTIRDDLKIPESWPEDEKMFGAAEGETLLVEGKTGKVVTRSERFVYNHNPPLRIPKSWWRDGVKPEEPLGIEESKNDKAKLIQWNGDSRVLAFGAKGRIKLGENEDFSISDAGDFAVVYRVMPQKTKKEKAVQKLRIINGETSAIQEIQIESDFYEVLSFAYWVESASSSLGDLRPR
ncbi:MAG: hypothetical protein ABF382_12725 [Akkermansiaceae bacterium]